MVWVTGHPGSGKTTLISSYVQSRDIPCLWYRFDHSDSDIASFFRHLAAARTVPSGKCKPLSLPPPKYPGDIAAFTRRFFEGLLMQVRPPAVIVFDNYQGFEQTSVIHEVIAAALASLPINARVVFTSRSCYPASLSAYALHHGINILGWEKLRLTEPEALEIAEKRATGYSRDTVRDFHKRAQGWVAGYVLLLEVGSPAAKGMNQGDALGAVFNDVNATTQPMFCGWIERFSQLGITSGCSSNPPLYCPDSPVTRGQMAVFISKALEQQAVPCTGEIFGDVGPQTQPMFCGWIEKFSGWWEIFFRYTSESIGMQTVQTSSGISPPGKQVFPAPCIPRAHCKSRLMDRNYTSVSIGESGETKHTQLHAGRHL